MKSKILIFLVVIEVSIIVIGGILGVLMVNIKEQIENIQCSADCCDGDGEEEENIRITSPQPNDIVTSPLVITGEARGTWYFEGEFPVDLYDKDCIKIGEGYASAQEFWMVPDFVSFQATIEFDPGDSTTGMLVLGKHNPTGCVQFDDNLLVPVGFE